MARILIVEDDADSRLLIRTMIEKLGHEAFAVGDGMGALGILGVDPGELAADVDPTVGSVFDDGEPPPTDGNWDLVLMDVVLSDLDGRDVCRQIRAAGRDVPVVAVTGLAMSGDRESCLEAGMDDYMAKPFTVDVMTDLLTAWLQG